MVKIRCCRHFSYGYMPPLLHLLFRLLSHLLIHGQLDAKDKFTI